jgi:hypothetical protein
MRESLMEFYFVVVMRLSLDNREATISFLIIHCSILGIGIRCFSVGRNSVWPQLDKANYKLMNYVQSQLWWVLF